MITRRWFVFVQADHKEGKGHARMEFIVSQKQWMANPRAAIDRAIIEFNKRWNQEYPREWFGDAMAIRVNRV